MVGDAGDPPHRAAAAVAVPTHTQQPTGPGNKAAADSGMSGWMGFYSRLIDMASRPRDWSRPATNANRGCRVSF